MTAAAEDELLKLRNEVDFLTGTRGQTVREMVAIAKSSLFPDLSVNDVLEMLIGRLYGTTVLEALYIISGLQSTVNIPGDVCEFGVAQGRTSALIAAVLAQQSCNRKLWLYDSFEGLPAPSSKDVLLHDLYGAGSMAAYKGYLSIPEMHVRDELRRIHFPAERTVICRGWIEDQLRADNAPRYISFAFLDMDFYQSTKDVLDLLLLRMPRGGVAVVDDYGFFSSGVQTAVHEVMTEHPKAFKLHHPYGFKYVVLERQ